MSIKIKITSIDELLEKADDAMYEAKKNKRNCFVFK